MPVLCRQEGSRTTKRFLPGTIAADYDGGLVHRPQNLGDVKSSKFWPRLLVCPETGEPLIRHGETLLSKSGQRFPIIAGKPRFYKLEAPDTTAVKPSTWNPSKWTPWRRACHAWLRDGMSSLDDTVTVLDVGAGPQQFQDLLQRFDCVQIDFHPFPNVHIVTDLTKPLPFPEASFDAAVLSNVLEHIPTPQDLLTEVRRILRPGGRAFLATPFLIGLHQEPHDFLRYTRHMFEFLFRHAGFSRWTIEEIGSPIEAAFHMLSVVAKRLHQDSPRPSPLRGLRAAVLRVACRTARIILETEARGNRNLAGLREVPQGYGCVGHA